MKWGGTDRTALAQDRERLRAVAKAVMYIWSPENAANFLNS